MYTSNIYCSSDIVVQNQPTDIAIKHGLQEDISTSISRERLPCYDRRLVQVPAVQRSFGLENIAVGRIMTMHELTEWGYIVLEILQNENYTVLNFKLIHNFV